MPHKLVLNIFAATLLLSFSWLAQAQSECGAILSPLEYVVTNQQAAVAQAGQAVEGLKLEIEAARKEMGFREKYLFAWLGKMLGGDPALIAQARTHKNTRAELERELQAAQANLSSADQKVVEAAQTWLSANDQEFAQLTKEEVTLCSLENAGTQCLAQIDEAISDVDSAQSDDMFAGVSDNKFMEMIAYGDTQTAKDSIEKAKQEIVKYHNTLEALKHQVTANHGIVPADHIEGVDPTMQLFMDLGTGGDFMDFLNYFRLGEVETQLKGVRDRIAAVHQNVETARKALVAQIDARVCALRDSCKVPKP